MLDEFHQQAARFSQSIGRIQAGMLQIVTQHHQVMNFAVGRMFCFPEEHLMEMRFASFFSVPYCAALWAVPRCFHRACYSCASSIVARVFRCANKGCISAGMLPSKNSINFDLRSMRTISSYV